MVVFDLECGQEVLPERTPVPERVQIKMEGVQIKVEGVNLGYVLSKWKSYKGSLQSIQRIDPVDFIQDFKCGPFEEHI